MSHAMMQQDDNDSRYGVHQMGLQIKMCNMRVPPSGGTSCHEALGQFVVLPFATESVLVPCHQDPER